MRERSILLVIFCSLIIFSCWTDTVVADYGYSRRLLKAHEWEVFWCVGVPNGYSITVFYSAETTAVDLYMVQRDFYNLTSKTTPGFYILHEVGQRSEFVVDGPLGDLYFVVYSPVEQWFEVENYIETPSENLVRVYGPPLISAILILLVSALLVWCRSRKIRK
jgi:hypothetical protein